MSRLNRDARHHALTQVGIDGQQRIAAGTVLLIGVGGIGCAVANYLAGSGVGHIILSDFDTVDETNLARQLLYTPADVGQRKVDVAARRLLDLNPDIRVSVFDERLRGAALATAVRSADIVVDGSDNFSTRFEVNDACVDEQRRLISGSAIRMEGQVAVFGPDYADSPCYRCLYTEADESLDSCAGNGVLSPVPAVIGSLMAVEALKSLVGIDISTASLTLYDASVREFRSLGIRKRMDCIACGRHNAR